MEKIMIEIYLEKEMRIIDDVIVKEVDDKNIKEEILVD